MDLKTMCNFQETGSAPADRNNFIPVDGGPRRRVMSTQASESVLLTHSHKPEAATQLSDCEAGSWPSQQKTGNSRKWESARIQPKCSRPGKHLQPHTPSRMCILTSSDLSGRERIFRFR